MNSIPKGYKKTEVGIIPEDWKFCYILDKKILMKLLFKQVLSALC